MIFVQRFTPHILPHSALYTASYTASYTARYIACYTARDITLHKNGVHVFLEFHKPRRLFFIVFDRLRLTRKKVTQFFSWFLLRSLLRSLLRFLLRSILRFRCQRCRVEKQRRQKTTKNTCVLYIRFLPSWKKKNRFLRNLVESLLESVFEWHFERLFESLFEGFFKSLTGVFEKRTAPKMAEKSRKERIFSSFVFHSTHF